MAFSSMKLASYSPVPRSLVCPMDSSSKPISFVSTGELHLQSKRNKSNIVRAVIKKDDEMSRREALSLMTGTVFLTSLVPANPASARISRTEMRRKIMEKLEQLREKAGWKKKEKKEPKLENKEPKLEKKEPKLEKKEEKKEASSLVD